MITNGVGILAVASSLIGAGLVSGAMNQEAPKETRAATAPKAVRASASQEREISVSLANAPVQQVFDWLKGQGVNFVASPNAIPESTRVTLNVQARPVSEVMEALGAALGGHWQRHGQTYSFSRGRDWTAVAPQIAEGFEFAMPKDFKFDVPPHDPKFQAEMKKLADEMKQFGEKAKGEKKSALEMEKLAKELQEKIQKEFKDKKWEFAIPDDARVRVFENGKLKELKELKELKGLNKLDIAPRVWAGEEFKGLKGLRLNEGLDAKKFVESITPAQLETMKKNGYLTVKDLTPAQIKMLGDIPKTGNWNISLSIDGKTVTIKGG